MDWWISAVPFAVALLIGMLICLEIGRRLGTRRLAKRPQGAVSGLSVVESAVFGLYGLLVAFTFSDAPTRMDVAKRQIQDETNAIGTAYMRLDLLRADSQTALREQLRNYLDSRIETYQALPDIKAAKEMLSKSAKLQTEIWSRAVAATGMQGVHPEAARLLLPALNDMFDIAGTRTMTARMHVPLIIFGLLFSLALVCSVLAGYGMAGEKDRSWMHIIAFVIITVITVYVILEIEYPRAGFIRINAYDQVLVDLRQSMR
jgi:hypothetical protein